jgi:hypothetical protein
MNYYRKLKRKIAWPLFPKVALAYISDDSFMFSMD